MATIFLAAGQTGAEPAQRKQDGLVLNGEIVLADGKTLADGVVLITHGTLAHHGMELIETLQAALADRGVNSLAITLSLGISDRKGMYDCAQPHRHRHTDALAEIGGWLDWLEQKGAGSVVLMGHSRGGNQTAWYAAEHDVPAVRKLVLLAPALWKPDPARADLLAKASGKDDGTLIDLPAFLYCRPATASAGAIRSYYGEDERQHTPQLIGKIKRPVLVIAGSDDTTVPGVQEAMTAEPDAAGAKVVVIDGADHFFRDLYVEDVADAVAAFVEGQ